MIDLASEYSADDVVARFAQQRSATIAAAVRLLGQQADLERGPGRLAIIESVCRLAELLDPDDVQSVAPVVAGSVLSEATSADWPAEATPGALILGVVGASQPLVRALLARQDAETLAEARILGRIAPVLTYARPDQAALVYELLGAAYSSYPEPLHDALGDLPADAAEALWEGTSGDVGRALKVLAAPVAPATAAVAAAATTPVTEETAAERYGALLTSVESRTDSRSERLISSVLKFGQEADEADVREAVSDRAAEVLNRITDPIARNEHAMLGLQHSPLHEAEWWAELLTASAPAPYGYVVFEHLVRALSGSSGQETQSILAAIPAVVPHIPVDELSDAQHWIGVILGRTAWATSTTKNRTALYRTAESLRPRLAESDASGLDVALATDLVGGLDGDLSDQAQVDQMLALAATLPASAAVEVEKLAVQRPTDETNVLPTLRLRLAAASRGSGASLTVADLLAVKGTRRAGGGVRRLAEPYPTAS